jgi:CO/xanthine dehydrogenase Mo-binding subunit
VTTRRDFLLQSGALVVSFAIPHAGFAQEGRGGGGSEALGSLGRTKFLDAWIRIDETGRVTVFTGKAELGQGIKTALMQVAAEELDVRFDRVTIVTADTATTANEGFTAGSNSMKDSGTAIRNAAAQVREILVAKAADRLGAPATTLRTEEGAVIGSRGRVTYGELVAGLQLHVEAKAASQFKDPRQYRVVSKPLARVDIPAKVTGGVAYVHDLRLPGMVHARVLRPPSYGATLESVDASAAEKVALGYA